MDITTVKNLLSIKTNAHDEYLATALPLFIEQAKDYCNQSFEDDNGTEQLPESVKLYVAKAIQHNMQPAGLKGRTMGEVSYTYDTELPITITRLLKPHRKVRFR